MKARAIDKMLLYLICSIMVYRMDGFERPVIIIVGGLVFAGLNLYFFDKKEMKLLFIMYILVCVAVPEFCFYLPLLLYDIYATKLWWGLIGVLPAIFEPPFEDSRQMILWLFVLAAGLWLSWHTVKYIEMKQKLIYLRDTSAELEMVLKEKNREILEKQDYEVYLATLKERNRIAREIHDNVGHMLSRSILQIGALLTVNKQEPLQEQLNSVRDTMNQAMSSIRESVHDLHDESIDLEQAIKEVTKEMAGKYKLRLEYDMGRHIPRAVKYCFIATVKEAMSNIVRHSNADSIAVILREHPGFFQMSIEDNGTFESEKSEHGMGLQNMKERVEALGGALHISWERGFRIFISIKKREDIK